MTINSGILSRIIYTLALGYYYLSRIFPLKAWVLLGKWLGMLFYFLDPYHRAIALINLRFAFGEDKTEKECKRLARKNAQQFFMLAHEWIRLKGTSEKRLLSKIRVEGEEHLLAAKQKNPSVILLSAHFGNWEYAHLYYARTYNTINFIVRAIDNPFIERIRVKYNKRFGVRILYKNNGLRTAISNLKKGEDLVIFPDQKTGLTEGIPCAFFGKKTSTISLVVALARRYAIPIIPMFTIRSEDNVHHRLVFLPEMEVIQDNGEQTLYMNTQKQNDTIERMIKKYPDHWLWFHRKWQCYHPEIYEK